MSDFLFILNKQYTGQDLLNLIQKPYGGHPPRGAFFQYPWGCFAVLEEHLAGNKNTFNKNGVSFAWIGDLAVDLQNYFIERFVSRFIELQQCSDTNGIRLQSDSLFNQLNGAFALIAANQEGFCIVTDPLSFVPVYIGTNDNNMPIAFGTHPDILAAVSSDCLKLDAVSAGEFLNSGYCTFPNTIHANVKEIAPGRVHIVKKRKSGQFILNDLIYWLPPKEICGCYDKLELAKELENIIRSAVESRCNAKKIAVLLSGGLDSRVILAAVPQSAECIGLTFSNELNRETNVASKVAKCYDRQWIPLIRDPELLSKSIVNIVKFISCQSQWVDAHNFGLSDRISKYDADFLLSGMLFDRFLKAGSAPDILIQERCNGYLPPKYLKTTVNYADAITNFWKERFKKEIVEGVYNRKGDYYRMHMDQNRSSLEWLNMYPFSQHYENAYWTADRRVLPLRLIATDRRILDFAFKCPFDLKLNNTILLTAALDIYGKGAYIINANDGCRPASKTYQKIFERAVYKFQDKAVKIFQKNRKSLKTQDSWHNYQGYWDNSAELESLKKQYSNYLDKFNGLLFENAGKELLFNDGIGWLYGFRLLQLAVWRDIMEQCYKR
ncbi:MAG: asparagine synthase-related protein [Phycisphaerae bacterium]|nr:asparagine synthase-related protein [Phycisphaerae bacterium]